MLLRHWPWLLIPILFVLGASRLRFDAEVLNLLPQDLPAVHGLLLQQRHFATSQELLVTVRTDEADLSERVAERVARLLSAETSVVRSVRWRPPWRDHPGDLAENLAWQWLQQPPGSLAHLEERLAPAELPRQIQSALDRLASSLDPSELMRTGYDPLGLSHVGADGDQSGAISEGDRLFADASGTFLRVEPAREEGDYRLTAAWLRHVQQISAAALSDLKAEERQQVRLGFTGGPAFRAEISSGMESDLRQSVTATVVLIAGLFWMAHRSWRPLGWLIVSLGLILALTLAVGGVLFGTLNIISVGFAAVLMGLAVDYGLVGYQEAVASPGAAPGEVRREVARGIWYSAATTAGTFVLLGFAGLPGLSLLGNMTALGLLLGALVMLYFYLPRVCPVRGSTADMAPRVALARLAASWPRLHRFVTGVLVGGALLVLLVRGLPPLTPSQDPLRPRSSQAYAAMDEMRSRLLRSGDPMLVIVEGRDAAQVAQRLESLSDSLAPAVVRGEVARVELPLAFWPRTHHAQSNRAPALRLSARATEIGNALTDAGFSTNAVALLRGTFSAWPALLDSVHAWPTNRTAEWLTRQFATRTPSGDWLALGAVHPGPGFTMSRGLKPLPEGVWLSHWNSLGLHLVSHVRERVVLLMALIAGVLIGFLWLAFRRWHEVALGAVALALSFLLLTAVMAAAGWEWNLLSLVALPLILGSSVDSTIHMQLALRRHRGDLAAVWGTTGKALMLCAGANIAGFGSLAWCSNMGLASLDLVCALGVACVFVVCVGVLPMWWLAFAPRPEAATAPVAPSLLYQARLWSAGLMLARHLPARVASRWARLAAWGYRVANPARFGTVTDNLLPVVGPDRAAARRCARRLFTRFADKLVDLWRQEAGAPLLAPVEPGSGWDHFTDAVRSGRGILLVTPHLGNWELGASLLTAAGIRPLVLTAREPGHGLTEARAEARQRQGIDTLVVGSDPFAFVEVIRRLQDGGLVALLIDRPAAATAVEVTFLGRPILASIAVAELARASGAVILPTYIVRDGDRHRAHTLPPVTYDRRALSDRAARVELTGRILRAFEPAVRQFPDQWFHFVPIWDTGASAETAR